MQPHKRQDRSRLFHMCNTDYVVYTNEKINPDFAATIHDRASSVYFGNIPSNVGEGKVQSLLKNKCCFMLLNSKTR